MKICVFGCLKDYNKNKKQNRILEYMLSTLRTSFALQPSLYLLIFFLALCQHFRNTFLEISYKVYQYATNNNTHTLSLFLSLSLTHTPFYPCNNKYLEFIVCILLEVKWLYIFALALQNHQITDRWFFWFILFRHFFIQLKPTALNFITQAQFTSLINGKVKLAPLDFLVCVFWVELIPEYESCVRK